MTKTTEVLLTIGIPTYNRVDTVRRRVEELLALDMPVEILVIDNASPDDTFATLTANFSQPSLTVLTNKTNLGYSGNILRLIDEASTPYLLFLSDEDSIDPVGLDTLIAFCREKSPTMVSPQAQVGNRLIYRGRKTTELIRPAEFNSSAFYISGVTINRELALADVPLIRELQATNSAAKVYPQVLFAALAVARGNSYFLAAHVTEKQEQLKTTITDISGADLRSVGSRWQQFLSYEEFFDLDHPSEFRVRLEQMREAQRRGIMRMIWGRMRIDLPTIESHIAQASTKLAISTFLNRLRRK